MSLYSQLLKLIDRTERSLRTLHLRENYLITEDITDPLIEALSKFGDMLEQRRSQHAVRDRVSVLDIPIHSRSACKFAQTPKCIAAIAESIKLMDTHCPVDRSWRGDMREEIWFDTHVCIFSVLVLAKDAIDDQRLLSNLDCILNIVDFTSMAGLYSFKFIDTEIKADYMKRLGVWHFESKTGELLGELDIDVRHGCLSKRPEWLSDQMVDVLRVMETIYTKHEGRALYDCACDHLNLEAVMLFKAGGVYNHEKGTVTKSSFLRNEITVPIKGDTVAWPRKDQATVENDVL